MLLMQDQEESKGPEQASCAALAASHDEPAIPPADAAAELLEADILQILDCQAMAVKARRDFEVSSHPPAPFQYQSWQVQVIKHKHKPKNLPPGPWHAPEMANSTQHVPYLY